MDDIEVTSDGGFPLRPLLNQRLQALVEDTRQAPFRAPFTRWPVPHDALDLALV